MRAGISTASLFLRQYTEEALATYASWGVDVTEVFLTSFTEYDPAFSKTLLSVRGKVAVHSVHTLTTQFEPQLYAEQPRVKDDAFLLLDNVLKNAYALGAKYYTFHGQARLKNSFKENFERVGARTAELCERCRTYGVTLAYENVDWCFYNRPEIFRELKKRAPLIAGVLDIKQARLSGYDWREYLNAMQGSLSHVHVSDFKDGKMCLPGRGEFDFNELFSRLSDIGFDGAILIENYKEDYGELAELKESYHFLLEKADKYSVK